MAKNWTNEEWRALPRAVQVAIHEYAREAQAAGQRAAAWEKWAEPNRKVIDRWQEIGPLLHEHGVDKVREKLTTPVLEEEWTYEEMQAEIRKNAREAQAARQEAAQSRELASNLYNHVGETRNMAQAIGARQSDMVQVAGEMAKWQIVNQRKDVREVLRAGRESGAKTWDEAVEAYSKSEASQPAAQHGRFFRRPDNQGEGRKFNVSRETDVQNRMLEILNGDGGSSDPGASPGSWTRPGRANRVPVGQS